MPNTPRIAYLLSRYPAISHTFFLHEVLGLRALGLHIQTASINPPDRSHAQLSDAEKAEAEQTFYLKDGSRPVAALRILITAVRHPAALWRGLRAALSIPGITLRVRTRWLAYLAEALLVGDWMRRNRLAHLHVHFGGAVASVGLLTSIAWCIPYSLTVHGPEELQNTATYHLRRKLRQASFVVCISDFCQSQLMQITPVAQWHKFTVVRLGVQVPELPSPREPASPLQILCVGRLVPEKGQHLLLRATAALRARGIPVFLTLAGDGPDRPSLQSEAAALGLGDAAHFAGATTHAETLQLCARADIFALASFAEGIPVALMEAMAHGVPCVSTYVAGIPELIRHGQDGLLVPPSNLQALTDALSELAADPALRRTMGHNARERVQTLYNRDINHRQLAQVLLSRVLPSEASV